jgi:ornithine cyclodeaminase/alanine dehydrogenase-like protein (mu-crystallin family)
MRLRVLTESDCRSLLGMREAIDIQAEAFGLLASGRAVEGLRSVATSEDPPGAAIFNPCFLRGGAGYGIKVVSEFHGNAARGLPRLSALIAVFDGETGLPRTLMEGGYVTDLRTGAGSALAARHLARSDSSSLAVIGAGRVARYQIEAFAAIFQLREIRLFARTPARGEALIKSLQSLPISLEKSAQAAASGADIVVTATTASQPVVQGEWLKPGAFVAAVGAYSAQSRELGSSVIRRAARHVIDSRTDCLERAGDFMIPVKEGILKRDDVAEIAEILSGARPGRGHADEIIVYKSSGVPIQDLVTAQHIERRAIERGLGTLLDLGGDHD